MTEATRNIDGTRLGEIVERTRADLEARRGDIDEAELRTRAADRGPARSLCDALVVARSGPFPLAVIAEVKRKSPSAGELAEIADPVALARTYADAGAAAISVLTDGPHFGGSVADLAAVADAQLALPVLRKDFVVDELQLLEARAHGADAVLLIAAVLGRDELARLLEYTHELGMEALVEVHDGAELDDAIAAGAQIVGINNRDLRTFEVDLATTEQLAALVPQGIVVVAESGVAHSDDARRMHACGVDAVLVGTALVTSGRPAAALRLFASGGAPFDPLPYRAGLGRPIVKLCGMRTPADARAAVEAGADAIGIVLAPSRRRVDVEEAAEIVAVARRTARELAVPAPVIFGVFVDEDAPTMAAIADAIGLDGVQASGAGAVRGFAQRPELLLRLSRVAAVHVGAPGTLLDHASAAMHVAHAIVFDTYRDEAAGGTGAPFDYAIIADLPEVVRVTGIIAGGLDPDSVGLVVEALDPLGVDVSSGIESDGVKDPVLMGSFIGAVHGAAASLVDPARHAELLDPGALRAGAHGRRAQMDGSGMLCERETTPADDADIPVERITDVTPVEAARLAVGRLGSKLAASAPKMLGIDLSGAGAGAGTAPAPSHRHHDPDEHGRFGSFGGAYVPETLVPTVAALTREYEIVRDDPAFQAELDDLLENYVGRPTPLQPARRLSAIVGGAQIWLKREDLAHTGSHKINNALGQALLARRLGKTRIIAETGAGQHGVATATACALLGLPCIVYMGAIDVERQHPNVVRMRMLGAEVRSVDEGSRTLKDAVNAAIRDWVASSDDTHYLIGSVVGMHPFPLIVRDFQRIIGVEARRQLLAARGVLPDTVVACVGGGSNAIGMFHAFLDDEDVKIYGAEAGGSSDDVGHNAASIAHGVPGVLHGARTMVLQSADGQIVETESISAGLDYPGVGPEHAYLAEIGRVTYDAVSDDESLEALGLLARTEGVIPAIESAHAVSLAVRIARGMPADQHLIVCISGRGDKDISTLLAREDDVTRLTELEQLAADDDSGSDA